MKESKSILNNKKCTGCGACAQICTFGAISMRFDQEGFLKPFIDREICTDCGRCELSCPTLHPKYENDISPICYAAHGDKDVQSVSTSGGIFFLLAKHIIEIGGIVFGAAFADDFFVHHISIKNIDDLPRICHTKYVQSNTGATFSEAKAYLESGQTVLYSGCSCQIAGIKAYLGKNYDNLILVDILCMQVPPAPLFRRYLDETYGGINNVLSVQFRDKQEGWEAKNLTVITKTKVPEINDFPLGWMTQSKTEQHPNYTVYHRNIQYDAYLKIFYEKLTMNQTCANCQFATFPRQGDISLGDFWGIHLHDKRFDRSGTNLLLINNKKGKNYIDKIKTNFQKCAIEPLKYIGGNRVKGKLLIYDKRDRLFELLSKMPIQKAVEQCQKNTYDIGIVGGWTTPNYGGSLTYYALYHLLNDMGFSTTLITHPFSVSWNSIIRNMKYEVFPYPSHAYIAAPRTITGLKRYNKLCDTFVVGSDQLFNYKLYHDMQGFVNLSWVHDNKRKIAYAASFGINDFYAPEDERAKLQYFLKKFDFFSVREESGVKLVNRRFARSAQWVLDPVFLCGSKHYDNLIQTCKNPPPHKPYLFTYMLDINLEREKIIQFFSKKLDLPSYAIVDAITDSIPQKSKWSVSTISNASNNQFLAYIKKANYIVTDSFHGMCFCIIFNIPFTVIVNSQRGSTRMESLSKLFGLEDRLVKNCSEEILEKQVIQNIDFNRVNEILDSEKGRCYKWLYNALTQEIAPKELSEYDILDMRIDAILTLLNKQNSLKTENNKKSPNFFTYIYQKIQGGIKCYKEHGLVYTARRMGQKLFKALRGKHK